VVIAFQISIREKPRSKDLRNNAENSQEASSLRYEQVCEQTLSLASPWGV
jgi:hypothetical protein